MFFILVGIAFVFGAGERKKLFWIALASLAVTLLNPRGFVLWQSVVGTFTAPGIRDLSPEWLPPLNQGWQMNIFFAWLILLVPLAAFARRRLSAFEWILFLTFSLVCADRNPLRDLGLVHHLCVDGFSHARTHPQKIRRNGWSDYPEP